MYGNLTGCEKHFWMGLIQIFCIDLKIICIERSQCSEPCVKRADTDVASFPRYWFLKFPEGQTMAQDMGKFEAGITAMAVHCFFHRNCEGLRGENSVRPWQFGPLLIFPYLPPWFGLPKLQKSIAPEWLNIWVCHFQTGFRIPRSFNRDGFQINIKDLN